MYSAREQSYRAFSILLLNRVHSHARSLRSIPQRDISSFSRFPANESLRRTGLHLFFRQNPVFISMHLRSPMHSCRIAPDHFNGIYKLTRQKMRILSLKITLGTQPAILSCTVCRPWGIMQKCNRKRI